LTAKTKETKTTAKVGTRDPVWEEEFILNGPNGLEGASALRVKIKDLGTGYFMSDKNLGQVTIPVGCFVPETEALLVLPIEPASLMPTANSTSPDLGEIKLSTELVAMSNFLNPLLSHDDVISSHNPPGSPKIVNRETVSSIGEAHIYCSLKEPTPYEVNLLLLLNVIVYCACFLISFFNTCYSQI
jgi:hypothetical protein